MDGSRANSAFKTARTTLDSKRWEEASVQFLDAARLYDEIGHPDGGVVCRGNAGKALLSRAAELIPAGKIDQAMHTLRRAAKLCLEGGETDLGAQTALAAAELMMQMGRFDPAIEWIDDALVDMERTGQKQRIADAQMQAAVAETISGRSAPALARLEAARAIYQELGNHEMLARCQLNVGAVLTDLGNPNEAIPILENVRVRLLEIGLEEEAADAAANVAKCYGQTGRKSEAQRIFQEAREVFDRLGCEKKAASTDTSIGGLLSGMGRIGEASEYLVRARDVYARLKSPRELVAVENNLAVCSETLGRVDEARQGYERALEIANASGLVREAGSIRVSLTRLGQRTDNESAREAFRRSRTEALAHGDEVAAAKAEMGEGALAVDEGDALDAIPLLRHALEVLEREGNTRDAAGSRMNLAMALAKTGHAAALEEFRVAKSTFESLDLLPDVAACDLNLGVALRNLGRLEEACSVLQRAHELYRQIGDPRGEAQSFVNLGTVFGDMGRMEEAITLFDNAREVYEAVGRRHEAAKCVANTSIALAMIGRNNEAATKIEEAARMFAELGQDVAEARCHQIRGNRLVSGGHLEEAMQAFALALAVVEPKKLLFEVATCYAGMGGALAGVGDQRIRRLEQLNQAIGVFQHSLDIFRRLKAEKLAAGVELNIGLVKTKMGLAEEGHRAITAAKATFDRLGFLVDSAEASANLGQLLRTQGDHEKAIEAYEESIALYEVFRQKLWDSRSRAALLEKVLRCYRGAMDSCLRLGQDLEALNYLERSKSRVLADQLAIPAIPGPDEIGQDLHHRLNVVSVRLAQESVFPRLRDDLLRHGIGERQERSTLHEFEDLVDELKQRAPTSPFLRGLEQSPARLDRLDEYLGLLPDERSALVEFGGGFDGRPVVFVATRRGGLEVLHYSEDVDDGLSTIWETWSVVYEPSAPQETKALAIDKTCRKLHETLLEGRVELLGPAQNGPRSLLAYLDSHLAPATADQPRTLMVVPAHQLFLLPLHAAFREDSGKRRYLIEDYVVQSTPSASLLARLQQRAAHPGARRALVVGDPKSRRPLPHAAKEARYVAEKLRSEGWSVDDLAGEEATAFQFLHGGVRAHGIRSGSYGHVHLSQHGGIDPRNGLVLYFAENESDAMDSNVCTEREIAATDLSGVDCVVAAACLTAVTNPDSVEYLGMGAAFLQAGVNSFMGTTYPLSDMGSSMLVRRLYEARSDGADWGTALRRAQLGMARSGSEHCGDGVPPNHPYHWAAFTFTGWSVPAPPD